VWLEALGPIFVEDEIIKNRVFAEVCIIGGISDPFDIALLHFFQHTEFALKLLETAACQDNTLFRHDSISFRSRCLDYTRDHPE
jgi:hypothetical protein